MLLFPGQGTQQFKVIKEVSGVNLSGRVMADHYDEIDTFNGVITSATPTEKEQWRQSGHPVTHKIVQPLPLANGATAEAGNLLGVGERLFTIQGVRNPGEINHYHVYYCEERRDVKCPI